MRRTTAGRHADYENPRGYYLDYSALADHSGTNKSGVPAIELPTGRLVFNPQDVAKFALGNLELYLSTGNADRRSLFESAVRVLMSEAELLPVGFASWPMPCAPRAHVEKLGSGWFSARSHGQCMSVLVRAGALLGVEGALELASRSMGGFETQIEDGGMLRETGDPGHDGGLASKMFLEEYPMLDRPSMVLSGHVRAMWGLYDLAAATDDPAARLLFDRCADGLEFVLERYDTGWWSRRDLDDQWRGVNLAGLRGHLIHILELRSLHHITGRPAFGDVSTRWRSYAERRWNATRVLWRVAGFRLRNHDSALVRMPCLS